MTKLLLAALASMNLTTAELSELTTATCTATATGPTFSFSGRMYFHFDTTCDAPVDSITINASVSGPTSISGTKTCTSTDKCSYLLAVTYQRGTWTWTNDTTYTGGTSVATNSVTYNQ